MKLSIKESILQLMREEAYSPLSKTELCQIFCASKADKDILNSILYEMEEEGLIYKTKKEKYGLPQKMNLFVGKLSVHPKGFAFLDT